ncbi:sensor domain-containing diguanylate cyclase [Halobacillus litoralis]|uniref:sensor domain-containing diguanylate cyclase n=1 Tax=Halobacillus litoralis TaxID=45668 RepID=UPI00249042EF|nr:sensor domain-containing diguanylate cyclase [Halobacillus litoralis]
MDGIQTLIKSQSLLENMFVHMNDGIALIKQKNESFTFTYMNPSMRQKYGELFGMNISDLHENTNQFYLVKALKRAGRFPGQVLWNSERAQSPFQENHYIQYIEDRTYLLFIKDEPISALGLLQRKEQELKESESRYQSLVETSPDSVFVHDEEDRIIYVNKAGIKLLGATEKSELHGQDIKAFVNDERADKVRERLATLFSGEIVKGPITRKLIKLDGSVIDVEMHGGLVKYHQVQAVQTICRNISERIAQRNALEKLAYYDQLTKVPNRRYFFDKLKDELERVEKTNSFLALLFIDMDNFKQINDRYGHQIGDEVLVIFTKRVEQGLRNSDFLSRLGGDEFVILLSGLTSLAQPQQVADRMMERISEPILLRGYTISINVSMGISIYPEHGTSQGVLMSKADHALYEAKEKGRNRVSIYKQE